MSDEILKEGIDKGKVKTILESLLFINERPIPVTELSEVIEVERKELSDILDEMVVTSGEAKTGISVVKVAGGYQMCSSPENEVWVKKMYQQRGRQKLSIAALETLAIIAYKQPITRLEIEAIRGVNVDGVSRKLLNLGLIKPGGRKDVIGKPFLYITTRKFLEYFGLNSLRDLPKLEEFSSLAEAASADKNAKPALKVKMFETGDELMKSPKELVDTGDENESTVMGMTEASDEEKNEISNEEKGDE